MQDDVRLSIKNNINTLLQIIPEILPMIDFDHNNPQHHLDVFEHTLLALSKSPKNFEIRLVILLHDIGKPHSYQDGKIRNFKGHHIVSSMIAEFILERFGYNKNFINEVCNLIKLHDTPIKKSEIEANPTFSYKRYLVQYCDAMAYNPDKLDKRKEYLNQVKKLIKMTNTK